MLPKELYILILEYLDYKNIEKMRLVSKDFSKILNKKFYYYLLDRDFLIDEKLFSNSELMYKHLDMVLEFKSDNNITLKYICKNIYYEEDLNFYSRIFKKFLYIDFIIALLLMKKTKYLTKLTGIKSKNANDLIKYFKENKRLIDNSSDEVKEFYRSLLKNKMLRKNFNMRKIIEEELSNKKDNSFYKYGILYREKENPSPDYHFLKSIKDWNNNQWTFMLLRDFGFDIKHIKNNPKDIYKQIIILGENKRYVEKYGGNYKYNSYVRSYFNILRVIFTTKTRLSQIYEYDPLYKLKIYKSLALTNKVTSLQGKLDNLYISYFEEKWRRYNYLLHVEKKKIKLWNNLMKS